MANTVTLTIPRYVDNSKADLAGATFTGPVVAPSFKGPLVGNAESATKATQDGNGKVITETYALKSSVPTKLSQMTNDSGFITNTYTGTMTITGNLTVSGTINGGTVVGATYANDYAELFEKGEETEVGDIIALDEESNDEKYIKAKASSNLIVGVHSGEYGYITGGDEGKSLEENLKNYIPVALIGRVHVKFIGPAKTGDYVVISNIDGVGRAMNSFDVTSHIIGRVIKGDNRIDTRLVRIIIK